MIRLADEHDFTFPADTECAVRIHSLYRIYGCHVPFLRFYTDGEGTILSLMDGVGILFAPQSIDDEWLAFLAFQQDITRLHTDDSTAHRLETTADWESSVGTVLKYGGVNRVGESDICDSPYLPDVYALLATNFPNMAPFEAWYVDYSHRVRHGFCHVAAVMDNDKPVSVATTVAETDTAVILGQVATDKAYRRRGYAAKCLASLIYRCQGRQLYILPVDEYAEKLYISLGFHRIGRWAELFRK